MQSKFNFTVASLNAVKPPKDADRVYVYDLRTVGLALCVTSAGGRTFYFYRKFDGQPGRLKLGGFPEITIEQARNIADINNGKIANGINPFEERRAARAAETFGELFKRYMEQHAKVHKKTWQDDQDQYDRYLESWGSRIARKVRKHDVRALHTRIGTDNGPYTANRLLSLIHTVYSKTETNGAEGTNPAKGIQRFKEQERERFLNPDEVPTFFKALDAEPSEMIRDYVMISILCGARRANVCAMRWDDLHLDRATWVIPDTKSGQPVTLALVPKIIDVLRRRRETIGVDDEGQVKSDWVFPSYGKTGHLVEPKGAWKNILTAAGIKDLRIHDLRRTLGSWLAANGESLTTIGKILGHKSTASTKIYARLHLGAVRASVETATTALLDAAIALPAPANMEGATK
ncbi:MAG TPA: site-specific integrase [Tepidisphaeraceae bacterium]|jgi:integrase